MALGSGRCRVAFLVSFPTQASPTPPAASPGTTPPQAAAPPAGYAGTDTCVTCHTDQEARRQGHASTGRRRIRARRRRRTGARAATVPGRRTSTTTPRATSRSSRQMKPAEVSETCLTLPQPRHARGLGRQRARARNLSCTHLPQRAQRRSRPERQLVKPTETQLCATCHRAAGGQDRARRGAHAGARGQDVVHARATTRTARSATSRI